MSTAVQEILIAFDRLTLEEQREAIAEILRRPSAGDYGDLSDDALVEIAAMTFQELDEREAADERAKAR
jgi:hypothetical protein